MKNRKKWWVGALLAIIVALIALIYLYNNNNIYELPDYDEEEIEEALLRVENLQKENTISFSFITDVHINNEEVSLNNLKAFNEVTNENYILFGAVGGDLYSAYTTDHDTGVEYITYVHDFLTQEIMKDVHFTKGNHECNAKLNEDEYISNEEYFSLVGDSVQSNIFENLDDNSSGYYYVDYEEQKLRFGVLNSFMGTGEEQVFSSQELAFIAKDLLNFDDKEDATKWNVVLICHNSNTSDKEKFNEILNAYINSQSVNLEDEIIDYSSISHATIVAVIEGHQHEDLYTTENGYLDIVVQRGYNMPEEALTKNELCFSIFTIDLDEKILYETRVGRGEDRQWSYSLENGNEDNIEDAA